MSRRVVDFAKVITHRFPLDQVDRALELGAGQARVQQNHDCALDSPRSVPVLRRKNGESASIITQSKGVKQMKITLDPLVHSDLSLPEIPFMAAKLGYENLELCSRDEFLPEYHPPRANADRIRNFKQALRDAGVDLASMLITYRWASPFEDEREAAVRYWKRAIEIALELECQDGELDPGSGAFAATFQLSRRSGDGGGV